MGTKVLLVLSTTDTALPAGSAAFGGKFLFSIDGTGQVGTDTQMLFADVADGSHTAQAWALDTAGNPIGQPATLSFVTPQAAAPAPAPSPVSSTYPAPSSLSVQFPA